MHRNWLRRQKEILAKDRWLVAVLTWLPVALIACLWWIFAQGIARDMPIGVVDLDHSQLSRQIVHHYDASPSLAIKHMYSDATAAKQALKSGDIYAYVVIPKGASKDVYISQPPQISAFVNTQFILVGRLVNSALVQAQGTLNAKLDAGKVLVQGNNTPTQALGKAVPVRSQITALFNKGANYAQFLISALVPAIWQIALVVSTVMILAANYRLHGMQAWLGETPVKNWLKTLAPYVPIFIMQGLAFTYWLYIALSWPFHGQFWILICAQILMVFACIVMGSMFYFLSMDATRAMSFAGAFTAPSFAFMGITFPVTDMNLLAQTWRNLLPVSHYIEVQTSQAHYGSSFLEVLPMLESLLGYLGPLVIVVVLIRKKHAKHKVTA
ncbi:ABC transporter permease [Vibrio sp. SCSIO 43136]|uniref:ABC transporter permease n=1 Tax=Vibrio sp. SCSIO 43136 TaxID=2819101 RepID=UPI0020758398|nr:ABC transporter permease [Vibrio sp. SCSIO 43136]USD66475.1 ABC transporter permease [Vibrio sp. SCSIO 43136]